MDDEMISLLVEANKQIYALESITAHKPGMKLFTSMYVRKEALMSSRIEGTQATLEDVLDPTIDQNANRDLSDVVNYVKATDFAVERLKTLPICYNTVSLAVKNLTSLNILKKTESKTYSYTAYLDILKKGI